MASFQLENTPNPNTVKVNADQLLYAGTIEYQKALTPNSQFAKDAFEIEGVEGIFILKDFFTITKSDEASFNEVTPKVLDLVTSYLNEGKSLGEDVVGAPEASRELTETEKKIVDVLDKYVRPAVAQDGGDITYHSFQDGTVYLQMKGACSGCPSSTATLKQGIETMMQRMIPEVHTVEAV